MARRRRPRWSRARRPVDGLASHGPRGRAGARDEHDRSPPVVVVTGGGHGIGAAIAEELGRTGSFVVTMDPLVSVDGADRLPTPEETTAGRIVAAGGTARASSASVTDLDAVHALFAGLVAERGGLDAVVNVAGISRPTGFATGREEDWLEVLRVHLDGYLNVLGAALPIMAAAGHGRILGVTSGSGWRAADTGAYGCAKRAVAALTWALGHRVPAGVVVNALSPIAVTRMVTSARAGGGTGAGPSAPPSRTGGLSMGSLPAPDQLGPLGAYLVDDPISWCTGQVIFGGGTEVAVIDRPRPLEVVRSDLGRSPAATLDTVTRDALMPVVAAQASNGGSTPRFATIFDGADAPAPAVADVRSCAIVTDRTGLAATITAALDARTVTCTTIAPPPTASFADAAAALASAEVDLGSLDVVVVALAAATTAGPGAAPGWERVLAEHTGIVEAIRTDAAWARAATDHARRVDRSIRLVVLNDATTAGGRSRAQASAQLSRSSRRATEDRVTAWAISVESAATQDVSSLAELTAHLVCSPETPALSGAELVVGGGWFGVRSHPRPSGSITFGGPELPDWFGAALADIVGTTVPPPGAATERALS